MSSPVQVVSPVFPPRKVRVNRSASHTGVPASRFIAETGGGGVKVVGLPSGPRLGRSFSQGDINGFNVQVIGMHYTPSPLVIPAKPTPSLRSLSVSPVLIKRDRKSSIVMSPPKRRASLRHLLSVDTRTALHAQRAEIAMEVAEEVGRLCDAGEPISTDAPLSVVVKSARQAARVESWLEARFDFGRSAAELMSDGITPESLASEILAMSAVMSPKKPWASGEIPIMFSGFDIVVSPEDLAFDSLDSVPEDSDESQDDSSEAMSNSSAASPVLRSAASSPPGLGSPPIQISPPPVIKPLNIVKDKKAGRSVAPLDNRMSKKTGIAVGLLAVGALLSSPAHPSFDQFDLALPETPSPYASHFNIPNSTENNLFDRVIDWQGTLPKGVFGDGDTSISPWHDGSPRMM